MLKVFLKKTKKMFFLFREMRHLNGGPEKKLLATPTQRNVYAVRSDKYDSDRAI